MLLHWIRQWHFYLALYGMGWVLMGVFLFVWRVDPWWYVVYGLGFIQNFVFTFVSRSRNRNRLDLHWPIAVCSNVVWFLCFREVVMHIQDWMILFWYGIATSCGSVVSMKASMIVERILGAAADGHLKKA